MTLESQVRLLKGYALFSAVALLALGGVVFSLVQGRARFEEIDVERINVVERDGKLKMTISNQERFPDAPMDGRVMKRGPDQKFPGIVFFNEEGDESGGLTFRSRRLPGGVEANASLNFDQYKHDRTLQLVYGEYQGQRTAGLVITDRPAISVSAILDRLEALQRMPDGPEKEAAGKRLGEESADLQRVFVGKTPDKAASVILSDTSGRPRLIMAVDGTGSPKLEFLDEGGKVLERLPRPR